LAGAFRGAGSKSSWVALAILLSAFVVLGRQFGFARSLPVAVAAVLLAMWEAWRRLDTEVLQPRREEAAIAEGYIRAVSAWAEEIPYRALGWDAPLLSSIYVEQRLEPAPVATPVSTDRTDSADSGEPTAGLGPLGLHQALERDSHLMVEGGPGAGKSTLLKHAALSLARGPRPERAQLVPVPLLARSLAGEGSMAAKIHKAATTELSGRLRAELPTALFENPPRPGAKWLVLVDGLDEVSDDRARGVLVSEIRTQAEDSSSPYRFVLTSRPDQGLARLGSKPFGYFVLLPLERRRVEELARGWFSSRRDAEPGRARQLLRQLEAIGLGDVAGSPLLLILTALISEQDRTATLLVRRAGLYEHFVNTMLGPAERERDTFRSFSSEWARAYPGVGGDCAQRVFINRRALLEHVARWLQSGGAGALEDEAAAHARRSGWVPATVEDADWLRRQMESLLLDTGMVTRRAGEAAFIHDTFREYLAASALVKEAGAPDTKVARALVGRWSKPRWREVVLFALGIWSEQDRDVTDVVRRLLPRGLLFAGTALGQGALVAPALRHSIIDELFVQRPLALDVLRLFPGDTRVAKGLRTLAQDANVNDQLRLDAARTLDEFVLTDEAANSLSQLARDGRARGFYRALAARSLDELGRTDEAVELLHELARELLPRPEGLHVAEQLHAIGQTDEAIALVVRLAEETESAHVKASAATLLARLDRADLAQPILGALLERARGDQLGQESDYLVGPLLLVGWVDEAAAILLKLVQNARLEPFRRWNHAKDVVKVGRGDELVKLASDRPADPWVPALVGLAFWRAEPDRSAELLSADARDPARDPKSRVLCAEALKAFVRFEQGEALLTALSQDPELEAAVRDNRGLVDRKLGT
jgi:tetratricopeptide (TPR) repeat protein